MTEEHQRVDLTQNINKNYKSNTIPSASCFLSKNVDINRRRHKGSVCTEAVEDECIPGSTVNQAVW